MGRDSTPDNVGHISFVLQDPIHSSVKYILYKYHHGVSFSNNPQSWGIKKRGIPLPVNMVYLPKERLISMNIQLFLFEIV